MTHINKPLTFLVQAWSATFFLSHMWEAIRDGRYENAMTSQFLYLAHRDEAQEAMDSMTPEERATLDGMAEIADGEPA